MTEALISLAIVILFSVLAWAANAGAEGMVWGGIAIATIGFAYGLPTAAVYHWRLWRVLVREDRLPRRWWVSPPAHHGLLPPADRPGVVLWGRDRRQRLRRDRTRHPRDERRTLANARSLTPAPSSRRSHGTPPAPATGG